MSLLGFRRPRYDDALPTHPRHINPDPQPDLTIQIDVTVPPGLEPDTEPACTCRAFDAIGQNPECPEHPWWAHDNDVLHLADLTRELGSALAAARATFGGGRT